MAGRWQRAVAIITRAELEAILDDYWRERAPGVEGCLAARSKMLCLPVYLGDDALAHETYQTWASLSSACHRHAYDLDPTVDELLRWIESVDALRARVTNRRNPE